jgi:PIN domain nuclease of toxin-antitoxin system
VRNVRSVLDASALLAYLWNEPGADVVREALSRRATMSTVNWAEVLSRLADLGDGPDAASRELAAQGIPGGLLEIVALTEEDALTIARLRPVTRAHGLSLAERACLATGRRLGVPVLTADRNWRGLSIEVTVQVIRP